MCATRYLTATAATLLTTLSVLAGHAAAADPVLRSGWATSTGSQSLVGGHEVTYRMLLGVGTSGTGLRLRLANRASDQPTRIAALRIARTADGIGRAAAINAETGVPVMFSGRSDVTIPARADVRSDLVAFPVAAGEFIAVSIYVPEGPVATNHPNTFGLGRWGGYQYHTDNGAGDHTQDPGAAAFTLQDSAFYWVDEVQVAGGGPGSIVALGDSLTDGATSVAAVIPERYGRRDSYPDVLGELLRAARGNAAPAVLNEGVSGDSVWGIKARLEQDVLALAGVQTVILCVGSNDVYTRHEALELAGEIREIARRIAERGIHVILGTVPPRRQYISTEGELQRQELNTYIRASGLPYADFDAVLRDPAEPDQLAAQMDGGDSAHPSSAGYAAMAAEASRVLAAEEAKAAAAARRPALAIARRRLRTALRRGLMVRVAGVAPASRVQLLATANGRRVAAASATTDASGGARLRLRFTGSARRRFARRASVSLVIALSDRSARQRIRLRR